MSGWGMAFIPSMFSTGRIFDSMADKLGSFEEPLRRAVQEVMIPSFATNFDVGGRPEWAPTKEPAASLSSSILVRTGELRAAATSIDIWTISDTEAAVTEAPTAYGVFHQFGTRKMAARPFLVMQEEDEERIQEVFLDWAVKEVFS